MLVDARRGPEREELELAALADARGVKLIVVATKSDKLRRSERSAALARFNTLGIEPILCSALRGEGIDGLRRRIAGCARDAQRAAAAPADTGGATDTPSR
jgi:GTP-binding protein EngB required for normal cell division